MAKVLHLQPAVDPELARLRLVAHMAGLNDRQVLAVVGVRAMAVGGHDAPHHAMVERERTKMFGDQNNGKALILIRTKSPRRHDAALFKAV